MSGFAPDPGLIAALVATAAAYAAGVRRVRRWPAARGASFGFGLAAVGFALMSGLDVYADRMLSVHMVEHMVLTFVAAPALVAGAPLALALRAADRPARRRLVSLLHGRVAAALTHPATTFALLPLALFATHLTPFYDFALRHSWAHALEHALYLAAALLFWLPVIGAEPLRRRLSGFTRTVYLVAAMPAMSALAAVLVSVDRPLYATYRRAAATLRISALSDQHLAGGLMWVAGALVLAAFTLAVAWRAWEREERRQAARDRYEEARAA